MVNLEIKDIYESGVTILNVIKTLILLDILVVLVVALLNSRLFGIINSTLFWIAVILFFAYRAHFRARIKNFLPPPSSLARIQIRQMLAATSIASLCFSLRTRSVTALEKESRSLIILATHSPGLSHGTGLPSDVGNDQCASRENLCLCCASFKVISFEPAFSLSILMKKSGRIYHFPA